MCLSEKPRRAAVSGKQKACQKTAGFLLLIKKQKYFWVPKRYKLKKQQEEIIKGETRKFVFGHSTESIQNAQRGVGRLEPYIRAEEEEKALNKAINAYNKDPANPVLKARVLNALHP